MRESHGAEHEVLQHEVSQWLKKDAEGSRIEMLARLCEALPEMKPGTGIQQDIIQSMITIAPEAAKISPVKTIEALSKSILWVGNEYIPHFAQLILLLESPAIKENASQALSALEESLMVCYCAILPKNVHGTGRANNICIDWQRYTFLSVINAIEAAPVDPEVSASILKMSETMTAMSKELSDIHDRIQFVAHEKLAAVH